MRILSFDTSGSDIQIALVQDAVVAFEQILAPEQKNRQEAGSLLLPAIDGAMKQLDWSKQSLDLIVVGVGPGSFTGVRVAVIAARSIGQALSLGVVPFSSLELLAYDSRRPCVVVLSAGPGKLFAAAYDANLTMGSASQLLAPFYGSAEDLESKISELKRGDHFEHWRLGEGIDQTTLATGDALIQNSPAANLAANAGLLAFQRESASKRDALANLYPWHKVLPLYLRSPSVTLKEPHDISKSKSPGVKRDS